MNMVPNSIPISSLPVLGIPIFFFFLQTVWCCPCTWGGWFFSCDLWSLYPPVHFLSKWFRDIIAITNSNGHSVSPWKILLWIFTSVKLFPLAVSSTLQFFIISSINLMISSDILYILRQSIIQLCGTMPFCCQSITTFFVSFCCPWGCVDQWIVILLFLLFPFSILFVLQFISE